MKTILFPFLCTAFTAAVGFATGRATVDTNYSKGFGDGVATVKTAVREGRVMKGPVHITGDLKRATFIVVNVIEPSPFFELTSPVVVSDVGFIHAGSSTDH